MELDPARRRALRQAFERKVEEHRRRYADQLAHADVLAARFELGSLVGVFARELRAVVPVRRYLVSLSPLALIPIAVGATATGMPGAAAVLGATPVVIPLCVGIAVLRGRPKRRTEWLYAFTGGFTLGDAPRTDVAPVRWGDVIEVREIWADRHHDEAPSTRELVAYDLRLADGTGREISRDHENVLDPYRQVGPLLSALSPGVLAETLPKPPRIDEVVATYAAGTGSRDSP